MGVADVGCEEGAVGVEGGGRGERRRQTEDVVFGGVVEFVAVGGAGFVDDAAAVAFVAVRAVSGSPLAVLFPSRSLWWRLTRSSSPDP